MRIKTWIRKNCTDLSGKRIAVTGSTGGLGRELSSYLASLGADLYLLDRNKRLSEEHRDRLVRQNPGIRVECITLDLEDVLSAERAVSKLIASGIDIFIHNAGAYSIPRHKTSSGYDNVFQINFATPYYMINRLLPTLRRAGGRVVAVGSIAHNYSKTDPRDIDFSERNAASRVYGNAKRYLMYALSELFRDEERVSLSVVHPGIAFTNITAHYPKPIFAIIKYPMKLIFMHPKRAALSLLSGVFSPTEYSTWTGPRIFDVWGLPKKKPLRTAALSERERIFSSAGDVYRRCAEAVARGE